MNKSEKNCSLGLGPFHLNFGPQLLVFRATSLPNFKFVRFFAISSKLKVRGRRTDRQTNRRTKCNA